MRWGPRALLALAVLCVSAFLGAGEVPEASGERSQRGSLVASLDGSLAPLTLPRDRVAPVTVRLAGGLWTDDDSPLPRVTRMELSLPREGILDARGLAVCSPRRLRYSVTAEAIAACGPALVGNGNLEAEIALPGQPAFMAHAQLLAFNARVEGRPAVVVHAFVGEPATIAVLVFRIRRGSERLGTTLVAQLPQALGPWPRLARFEMKFSRRFMHEGELRSFLSASCPLPPALKAGFLTLARARYALAGGGEITTEITRGCRAR